MATILRHTEVGFIPLAAAINAARALGVGTNVHLDASEVTVTAATATDLPTTLALLNNAYSTLQFHYADTVCCKAADAADATASPVNGAATTLATGLSTYTAAKNAYATHIASTTVHYTADATNTLVATAPTDLPSLITAANELKTKVNAHLASAPAGAAIRVVNA